MSQSLYREFQLKTPAAWAALFAFVKSNYQGVTERGGMIRIIVTEDEKKRNTEQNKRYWGFLLKVISEQAWANGQQFSKDVWHEFMARKFGICEDLLLPNGEVIVRRKSTTGMSVAEFCEYMNQVESFAAMELGVIFD